MKTIHALGALVGLLIAMMVFDQIIMEILPLTYQCGEGFTANITGHNCYLNTNATYIKSIPSNFATGLQFIQNIFGIIGILGIFEIMYKTLRKMI